MSEQQQKKGITGQLLELAEEHKEEIGMVLGTLAIEGLRRFVKSGSNKTADSLTDGEEEVS